MADIPLPNYPQPFGSRNVIVTTHQGPTAYVAGGEVVTAATFGWSTFDHAQAGQSFNANNTATYTIRVTYPTGQAPAVANNNITNTQIPSGSNNVTLKWIVNANGNEVANNVNLSSEFGRIEYFGG